VRLGVLVVVAAALLALPAHAVVPGKDGAIAFDNFSADNASQDIFVTHAGVGDLTDLTSTSDADDSDPAVSPNGKQIAFVSDRSADGTNFIYVMSSDGSGVHKLGGGGLEQESPTWSPDGKKIAFSRCSHEQEGGGQCTSGEIATISPSGKNLKVITKPSATVTVDAGPTWSPNGKTIVFQRRANFGDVTVWSVGTDGKKLKRLLDDQSQLDHSPSFSPNGKQLVYASDTEGNEALYLMNATGGHVHKLVEGVTDPDDPGAQGEGSESPSFAPSGKRIVYVAGGELWVVPIDGSSTTQLTEDGGENPDWGRS
jgi:Tol biopolymer transport system component